MKISELSLKTVILQMRVWALYSCQRKYIYLMVPFFICQIVTMSVILGFQNANSSGESFCPPIVLTGRLDNEEYAQVS